MIGKILVTGASGYIGGRLVPELLDRGYQVRVMVRGSPLEYSRLWPKAEIAVADARQIEGLRIAFKGIDTAYYLIHSLQLGSKEFAAADLQAARNFRQAAQEAGIKRIIYLGGLGDVRGGVLSTHLRSRLEVAEELKRGKVPVTILRAAIIVGSGSASYEIIQHLVKRLRIIPMPRWAKNRCQPIAIRDVIKYLVGVLETLETSGNSFDIGGKDILTYEKMLKVLGEVLRKKIFFFPVPFSNIRFYAYFASLLTPVPASITECLMEGLKNEVICQDERIKDILPFEALSYKEAIIRAMTREEQDRVHTRWSDAYPPAHALALKLHELEKTPDYVVHYSLLTEKNASSLFSSICKIGGKEGWFHSNWLWRLRGGIDRILLGVGTARGRKSQSSLKINDVVDFWRIEDFQENQRLLLRAEMKLPGKAWLEFSITDEGGKRKLSIAAYYDTQSLFGKIYWYLCLPFHRFIFVNLIEEIERRS
ncbi:MAG: SDR family oxidoreductase [Candidatus Omnitrophota bacterium]|nr:SDR family oxidoreductase [Candidatus Omnitrophota bacterium]